MKYTDCSDGDIPPHGSRVLTLREVEEDYLRNLIQLTNGNIRQAARIAGIHRPTFYSKMRKLHLQDVVAAARDKSHFVEEEPEQAIAQ